jgi:hypothetical protein
MTPIYIKYEILQFYDDAMLRNVTVSSQSREVAVVAFYSHRQFWGTFA